MPMQTAEDYEDEPGEESPWYYRGRYYADASDVARLRSWNLAATPQPSVSPAAVDAFRDSEGAELEDGDGCDSHGNERAA